MSTSLRASSRAEAGSRAGEAPLRVAVLAGGRSAEHEVSLASAQSVREGLIEAGHEALLVSISAQGRWSHEGEPVRLVPAGGLLGADVVFPALHGPFGEDGTVQGVLEALDVPYVGAGVGASAIAMDKLLFKGLMAGAGVPQVRFAGLTRERFEQARTQALGTLDGLALPVFVKPARMGSSLGIRKVLAREAMPGALEHALRYDDRVIVEECASGIEVECALLGAGADPLVSAPGQIVVKGEWYDFAAKYRPGEMRLVVPAPLSAPVTQRVRALAREAFVRIGCEGLARVDFFVDGERVLVNELNTMPGFTPTSVYAKLIASAGIAYPELVDRLCRLALERHSRARARVRT